jgi:3'-phosphoadenosine 5'-phosphosulfate sulfotransferase (PAPS reductase)/FAD synthetase
LDQALINHSRWLIAEGLRNSPISAVMWSGGKDSMVLLHLVRQHCFHAGVRMLPVIFFREPWQPRKYEFHDRIIRGWGLQVLSWHPSGVGVQERDGEFEIQNLYRIGQLGVTCPTGIVGMDLADDWVCGLEMLRRPTQEKLEIYPHLQGLFIGHKRSDTDVVAGGDVGVRAEASVNEEGSTYYFPLRDWTDEDIWQYVEKEGIPYDEARYFYDEARRMYREDPSRSHNADYVHACTACMQRGPEAPRYVECPKLNGLKIPNVSEDLPWLTHSPTRYMLPAEDE